ncbi:MAG: late competence development ComFB family protein [Bacillota bacterium]|nr:late competence development ComFB family protein [Bacillota bacterium]
MQVMNIMEKMVWDNMDIVLDAKKGACHCEKCRADVAAYALNRLKPKYVATPKGETLAKADYLDIQSHLKVIVALTEAVEIVAAYPRHEKEQKRNL